MNTSASLIIAPTAYTPSIKFDVENGVYEVEGRAMLDGMTDIHARVTAWIDANLPKMQTTFSISFKLKYVDSIGSKVLSMLMTKLETYYQSGISVEVRWYYNLHDDDICSIGEYFTKMKKLPVRMIGIVKS